MSGDRRRVEPLQSTVRAATGLAETRFVPQRYEPNYAYPLLVLFHGRGGDEDQLIRALPSVSWRNYVGLGLRGPEVLERDNHPVGYGWGPAYARPRGGYRSAPWTPPEPPLTVFQRAVEGQVPDAADLIEDGVFAAVKDVMRALHVHSERIFLVGVGEGAAAAMRLGLCYPDRFAGVVSLNGWLPPGLLRAPVDLKACRDLRFLCVHGQWNSRVPIAQMKRDVTTLRAAGLRVASQSYPCANRLTSPMLADVDTWLIQQCTAPA